MRTPEGWAKSVHISETSSIVNTFCTVHIMNPPQKTVSTINGRPHRGSGHKANLYCKSIVEKNG